MKRTFLLGLACISLFAGNVKAMEPEEVIEHLKQDETLRRELTPEKVAILREHLLAWSLPQWPRTTSQQVLETVDWETEIKGLLPSGTLVSRSPLKAGQPLSWSWLEGTGQTSKVVLDGALFPAVKDAQLKLLSELLWQHSPRHVTVSVSQNDFPETIRVQTKTSAYLVFRNAYVQMHRISASPAKRGDSPKDFEYLLTGLQSRLAILPTQAHQDHPYACRIKLAQGTNLVVGKWQEIAVVVPQGLRKGDVSISPVEDTLVTQETWTDKDGEYWRRVRPTAPGLVHFRVNGTDANGRVVEQNLEVMAVGEPIPAVE